MLKLKNPPCLTRDKTQKMCMMWSGLKLSHHTHYLCSYILCYLIVNELQLNFYFLYTFNYEVWDIWLISEMELKGQLCRFSTLSSSIWIWCILWNPTIFSLNVLGVSGTQLQNLLYFLEPVMSLVPGRTTNCLHLTISPLQRGFSGSSGPKTPHY